VNIVLLTQRSELLPGSKSKLELLLLPSLSKSGFVAGALRKFMGLAGHVVEVRNAMRPCTVRSVIHIVEAFSFVNTDSASVEYADLKLTTLFQSVLVELVTRATSVLCVVPAIRLQLLCFAQ
jgi:hypothetical protein